MPRLIFMLFLSAIVVYLDLGVCAFSLVINPYLPFEQYVAERLSRYCSPEMLIPTAIAVLLHVCNCYWHLPKSKYFDFLNRRSTGFKLLISVIYAGVISSTVKFFLLFV